MRRSWARFPPWALTPGRRLKRPADTYNNSDVPERAGVEDEDVARYGVGRLLTLSDGVFAIALTLLVLSLRVDITTPASGLGAALRDARPELYAYGLSVLVIGAFWMGHHRLYSQIVRVDSRLLWMNILYLGLVALIPYPTDLLGRYGHEADAVALYGTVIGLGALVSVGISIYAERHRLVDVGSASGALARGLPIAIVFLGSVPIAFSSPKAAQFVWLLAVPLRIVAPRLSSRSSARA
jgi:TMEM175 potassium channel family protein